MRYISNYKFLVLLLLLSSSISAQLVEQDRVKSTGSTNLLGVQPTQSAFSLIDLSKVRWSNSYSVSFFSGGNHSGSAGLLNSTMTYVFSNKLSMAFNVGVLHNAGSLWGSGNNDATILPGFALDYHPSSSFRMSISVQQRNGANDSYRSYAPWRRHQYYDPIYQLQEE